jgi:hypothetical protein
MMRSIGLARSAALFAVLAGLAAPGAVAETRHEFWPEIDVWLKLGAKERLLFQWTHSSGRDYYFEETLWAVSYDYRVKPSLGLRGSYAYIVGDEQDGMTDIEHRVVLAATPSWTFHPGWLLTDRNRVDLRLKDGVFSWRYRNRLQIEKDVRVGSYTLIPYGSAEIFFDSRFDVFNRNLLTAGLQFPISPALMLDLYFSRQNDSRTEPEHVNAFGVTLNIYR